jgi:hypothetical protein
VGGGFFFLTLIFSLGGLKFRVCVCGSTSGQAIILQMGTGCSYIHENIGVEPVLSHSDSSSVVSAVLIACLGGG